jgi:hypothetical protein
MKTIKINPLFTKTKDETIEAVSSHISAFQRYYKAYDDEGLKCYIHIGSLRVEVSEGEFQRVKQLHAEA